MSERAERTEYQHAASVFEVRIPQLVLVSAPDLKSFLMRMKHRDKAMTGEGMVINHHQSDCTAHETSPFIV